jgi:hypothetical protein
MTIYKALKKIDTLTKPELKHCIQRLDAEIEGYYRCIENYPPDKLKKYGLPYLKRLMDRKQLFTDKLNNYDNANRPVQGNH